MAELGTHIQHLNIVQICTMQESPRKHKLDYQYFKNVNFKRTYLAKESRDLGKHLPG